MIYSDPADDGYFRVIQFTPPGSGCSVIFGKNVTAATPGSAQGWYLIVSDVEAARSELIGRGIEISEVFHDANGDYAGTDEPFLFGRLFLPALVGRECVVLFPLLHVFLEHLCVEPLQRQGS